MFRLCSLSIVVPDLDWAFNCDRISTNATHVWCLRHGELAAVCIVVGPERHSNYVSSLLITAIARLLFKYVGALCKRIFWNPINHICHGLCCLQIINLTWCNSQSEVLLGWRHDASKRLWESMTLISYLLVCHHRDNILTNVFKPASNKFSLVSICLTTRVRIGSRYFEAEEGVVGEGANFVSTAILLIHWLHVVLLIF